MQLMQETLPGYGKLPSNAEFVQANTENCALGLGLLSSQSLQTTTARSHTYKHYIFMNSYVRGPFLPNYLMVSMVTSLTAISDVKLTITQLPVHAQATAQVANNKLSALFWSGHS